jgi:eukaryotic-like serine/threonine-protein kinase
MSDTTLGTTLAGRYRLEATIGRGGMSTVYRAFDTVLERPVAIKLMHREIASDSDQLERFRREARAVAGLSHPHVVTVIDAGEQPPEGLVDEFARPADLVATPFIVFELVEGETLKQVISRGPLEIPRAIAYAIEIARALGVAHEHMLVHRDVKPQNILIDLEGRAKITDFGIARTLTERGLTLDGRVLGTTDYVSPEQALGQRVTRQSDVYSLGVVLFEMLTGTVPFRGGTPVTVAMRHVREELPDVQVLRPEVSAATAAVVERATAKDRTDRYPDMASFELDLEDVLAIETARSGQATGEVTSVLSTVPGRIRDRVPWRIRHPVRWLATLVILALIVALALFLAVPRTHRGTGGAPDVVSGPGLTQIQLGQTSATSYNPFGTGPENRDQAQFVVDSDPTTSWSTERYYEDNLGVKAGGGGTGIYVDASPGVAAKQIEIQTPTPGFAAQIWVASSYKELPYGNATSLAARGWIGPVASDHSVSAQAHIPLHLNHLYRYYLVWITALPPGRELATISELTLFK